jgi:hypothetical protein
VEVQRPRLMLEAVSEHILNTGDQEQLSSLVALAKRTLTDEAAAKRLANQMWEAYQSYDEPTQQAINVEYVRKCKAHISVMNNRPTKGVFGPPIIVMIDNPEIRQELVAAEPGAPG